MWHNSPWLWVIGAAVGAVVGGVLSFPIGATGGAITGKVVTETASLTKKAVNKALLKLGIKKKIVLTKKQQTKLEKKEIDPKKVKGVIEEINGIIDSKKPKQPAERFRCYRRIIELKQLKHDLQQGEKGIITGKDRELLNKDKDISLHGEFYRSPIGFFKPPMVEGDCGLCSVEGQERLFVQAVNS